MKPLSFSRAEFAIWASLVLGAVALVLASYAENVMAAHKRANQTSLSAPEFVFGPEVFVRGKGKSEEIREFSIEGFVGPFILHADNGASEATDENPPIGRFGSIVSLNGETVLRDGDFAHAGSVNRIEVELENPSTLVVKQHGRPGNELTIWIEGTKGAEVNPIGATVTDPNGVWKLEFPSGAVDSPTEVSVEPAIDFPDDTTLVPRTAFEFGPDGTQFLVPVQLTIAYDPTFLPVDVLESDLRLHKRVGGSWLKVAGSSVDEANDTVTGSINRFSTYAVLGLAGGKLIFQGTFTNDTVDGLPGSPEIGTWTLINELAGTIRVRSAVGDLTDNPVELAQTAGIVGGVNLGGTVAGTPPNTGVFVVRWRSLVASADTSVVSIALRGGIPGRPPLAVLTYVPGGFLQYNTTTLSDTWSVGISQLFEMTVDLDAKMTRLSIDGFPVIQDSFFLPAVDLERISIDMGGMKAQTLAWDNVEIQRKSIRNILIYGPSLTAPTMAVPENERTLAEALGFTVTVADAATWASMTTADFEAFDAIVMGDKGGSVVNCPAFPFGTAIATRGVWSPAVTGPIILIGGNARFHQGNNSGFRLAQIIALMKNSIKFAASESETGLYLMLGCHFLRQDLSTLLSGFGSIGAVRTASDIVVINDPTHPAMQGLTDAGLSGWSVPVHYTFSFPVTFNVVATGKRGAPYIIARP